MSNRLTFSLASLIFLIALGLVFVPTSVMAHDAAQTGSPATVGPHTHPVLEAVTADASATPPVLAVPLHGHHPMVRSIALKSGDRVRDNMVEVGAAPDGGQTDKLDANEFVLVITFDRPVVHATGATDQDADNDGNIDNDDAALIIAASEVVHSVRNKKRVALATQTDITIAAATLVGKDYTKLEVLVTAAATAIPTGMSDDDTETVILRVQLPAGAVFSAQTTPDAPDGVGTLTVPGGASSASSVYEFTLVKALPGLTPTVMIEAESGATVDAAFDVTFTFGDPAPSASGFTDDDIMVTGGVVTDGPTVDENNAKMWTATITPILGATEVTVGVASAKATGTAASVDATTDSTDPTVTITALAQSGRTLPIRITMADDTALASDAAIDKATEVTVTGGTLGTLTKAGNVYSGDITINYDTASVMVIVAADAVADTSGNMSDAASETFMVTAVSMERDEILAGGYRVLVGPGFDRRTLLGVTPVEIQNFPEDLATFLIGGGTVDVVATGGDVIINEFMVARDAHKIGTGDPTDGQWIELYNQHATETATGITVTFSDAKPAPAHPTGLQDRLSNVVGQGWPFPGTLGVKVLDGSSDPDGRKDFTSIRRKEPGKDGWTRGHWEIASSSLLFATGRVGTPGGKNTVDVFTPVTDTMPKRTDVLISEVANRMDDTKEWIELKGPANKSLKNWRLSIATAVGTEEIIFQFPNNDSIRISDNGYLLLTDVDPLNDEKGLAADYENGVPAPKRYKNGVVELKPLPNHGNFVLILRNHDDKGHVKSIEDIAGHVPNNGLGNDNPYTTLWPLTGNVGTINARNKLDGGHVYRRLRENINGYSQEGNHVDRPAFGRVGFTGLGYDRNAVATNPENGGTPGYPHSAYKGDGAEAKGNVVISEIMFATGNGGPARNRNLAQWIEIHNMSDTNSVNLTNWKLDIVNSGVDAAGKEYAHEFAPSVSLEGTIPPNQTYLIVARSLGVSQQTRLPRERIRNAGKKFTEQLLNPHGFHLTLKAKANKAAHEQVIVDTVGNLNPAPDSRRANAHSFAGNAWELSALGHAINEDGTRISISRRHGAWSAPNTVATGTDMQGWILTSEDPRYSGIQQLTWFGRQDDHATPGYTIGAALPVSLSTFRPERLKDTGEIVIRWTTESELNNAGFNILRSETRDGQFTKLNTQLIAGQGTTSERTTYEWKDTTAKPNVVYFYQIQDVSIDGDVATLRTARLRGNVSAVGKATTTWGKLKTLQ